MTASKLDSIELYRRIFEGMQDPILLLKNGRFIDCNAAALTMHIARLPA
jgi:PAS domain-containing protein